MAHNMECIRNRFWSITCNWDTLYAFLFSLSRFKLCQREEVPPEEYPSRVTLLNNHKKQFGKNLGGCSIITLQSDHRE